MASKNRSEPRILSEEMKKLIIVLLMMEIIKKPMYRDHFSNNKWLQDPVIRLLLLSRDKFFLLLRCLHFNLHSSNKKERLSFLISNLNLKKIILDIDKIKNFAIDESIISFGGR